MSDQSIQTLTVAFTDAIIAQASEGDLPFSDILHAVCDLIAALTLDFNLREDQVSLLLVQFNTNVQQARQCLSGECGANHNPTLN